jgi:hypothetical protein
MAISVQCERDRAVGQHLLDHLRVDLSQQEEAGRRVSEVVDPNFENSGRRKNHVEVAPVAKPGVISRTSGNRAPSLLALCRWADAHEVCLGTMFAK